MQEDGTARELPKTRPHHRTSTGGKEANCYENLRTKRFICCGEVHIVLFELINNSLSA